MAALHQAATDALPATGLGKERPGLGAGDAAPWRARLDGEKTGPKFSWKTPWIEIFYGQFNEIFLW